MILNKYNYKAHKWDRYTPEEQEEYDAIMGYLMHSESKEELREAGNWLQEHNDKYYLRVHGKPRGVEWVRQ